MRTISKVMWVLVALTAVGDIVTTLYGLHLGYTEGNPLVAWTLAYAPPVVSLVTIKLVAVCICYAAYRMVSRSKWVIPLSMSIPWAIAVGINISILA